MSEKSVSESRVLEALERSDEPLSVKKLADRLGVDWHTAKKRLDKLEDKNRVARRDVNKQLTLYSDTEPVL